MTGPPPSVHDSRLASTSQQSGSDGAGSGRSRLLALGSVGVVLLSAAVSTIAYGTLPEQMRIHWTLGMGPYYGPEFAPTLAVLVSFPLLIVGLALGAYWLDAQLRDTEAFSYLQPYYVATVVGLLGILLTSQAALIIANL